MNYCGCFRKHLTSCQTPPLCRRPACHRSPKKTEPPSERHERERGAGSQSSCREGEVFTNTEGGFLFVNMFTSPSSTKACLPIRRGKLPKLLNTQIFRVVPLFLSQKRHCLEKFYTDIQKGPKVLDFLLDPAVYLLKLKSDTL